MYLDPTNDIAFRRIFSNENKKEILISFLNSILGLKNSKLITEIEIANPYQIPKIRELKETILDVRCIDKRGINYIVEMQVCEPSGFEKRALYYTSKAYSVQIGRGEDYPLLNQVIFLGILYFNMFKGKNYLSNHLILDSVTSENKFKDFRFCFIELLKFNKSEGELRSVEDKWIYFLKNAKNLKAVPKVIVEKEIKEAFEILAAFKWSKKELDLYDKMGIYRQDERGRIELGAKRALKKGIEKGIERGIEKGIKKNKEETVIRMLSKSYALEEIIEITGLTREEIEKIKDLSA